MDPGLIVLPPILEYEVFNPGVAFLEKPVTVSCPPAVFPDSSLFTITHLAGGKVGFFVFRQNWLGSDLEVWDPAGTRWALVSSQDLGSLEPMALNFQENLWQGLLVPAGQKDQTGKAAFDKDVGGGYPRYTIQAYFSSLYEGKLITGLSPASLPVSFASVQDSNLAGLQTGEGETLQDATLVRLYLSNSFHRQVGMLEIRASGDTSEIEIANFNEFGGRIAVVRLLQTGEIRLEPSLSQRVIIDGDLEAEHIVYRNSSGIKVTLP